MKTIIDAEQRRVALDLGELVTYRDLLFTLAWRDLRIRYAQTYLGLLWAVVQPLAMLVIFSLVFKRVAHIDSGGAPYPLFVLAGMVPWTYFTFLAHQAGSAMVVNRPMITKMYFPRMIIPLSKAVVGLVDFAVGLLLLVVLFFFYAQPLRASLAWLPVFLALTLLAGLTAGVWLSALSVRYRDVQTVLPFLLQFGLFATPVAYPVEMVPEKFRIFYALNPMSGIVEGFRWSLLGGKAPETTIFIGAAVIIFLFIGGLYFFRYHERTMVDAL